MPSPSVDRLCKLRVEVAGRSRTISIKNEADIQETIADLHEAMKDEGKPYGVTDFWKRLDQRVSKVLKAAETEGVSSQKTVQAVRRAKTLADDLVYQILSELTCDE